MPEQDTGSSDAGRPDTAGCDVTLVVMTRDRLPDLLRTLPRHTGPVVVVDNGSSDGTVAALTALRRPGLHVVPLGENRGSSARNVGVELARTPLVAFADDDSWWAPGALELASRLFAEHPAMGLLAARVLVGEREALDPMSTLMAQAPLGRSAALPGPDVMGFMACAAVVRREAFLDAGGFDRVVFFAGEEERFVLDLTTHCWRSAYVEEVVAHHHPSTQRGGARGREALVTRNHLLTAVMRRPWRVVVTRVVAALRAGPGGRLGVLHAVPRLPAALRARRPVPDWVEAMAVQVDARREHERGNDREVPGLEPGVDGQGAARC